MGLHLLGLAELQLELLLLRHVQQVGHRAVLRLGDVEVGHPRRRGAGAGRGHGGRPPGAPPPGRRGRAASRARASLREGGVEQLRRSGRPLGRRPRSAVSIASLTSITAASKASLPSSRAAPNGGGGGEGVQRHGHRRRGGGRGRGVGGQAAQRQPFGRRLLAHQPQQQLVVPQARDGGGPARGGSQRRLGGASAARGAQGGVHRLAGRALARPAGAPPRPRRARRR